MSEQASGRGTYRRLIGYVRPYWPFWLLALVGMVFDAAASGAFVRLIKPMLDDLFVARDAEVIFWMPMISMTRRCSASRGNSTCPRRFS